MRLLNQLTSRLSNFEKLASVFLFVILANTACVGTIEDTKKVDKSTIAPQVQIKFDGLYRCDAISSSKVDVQFYPAGSSTGVLDDIAYQLFQDGNSQQAVSSALAKDLEIDANGRHHLVVDELNRNTKYNFNLKAYNTATGEFDDNTINCTVKTMEEEVPKFDGLLEAYPPSGRPGYSNLMLEWNPATPYKYELGNIAKWDYKIAGYNFYKVEDGDIDNLTLVTHKPQGQDDDDELIDEFKMPVTEVPEGKEYFFIVRAYDNLGREEKNVRVVSGTTNPSGEAIYFLGIKTLEKIPSDKGFSTLRATWDKATGNFDKYVIKAYPEVAVGEPDPSMGQYAKGQMPIEWVNDLFTDPYNRGAITVTDQTSAEVSGLHRKTNYKVYVYACRSENDIEKCDRAEGWQQGLTEITQPEVAPFKGVTGFETVLGSQGLESTKVIWNPPVESLGVCDHIELYHNTSQGYKLVPSRDRRLTDAEEASGEFSTLRHNGGSTIACSEGGVIVEGLVERENACFKAKVSAADVIEKSLDDYEPKCTKTYYKAPFFDGVADCIPGDDGQSLEIKWELPPQNDGTMYSKFRLWLTVEDFPVLGGAPGEGYVDEGKWVDDIMLYQGAGSADVGLVTQPEEPNTQATSKILNDLAPNTGYRVMVRTELQTNDGTIYRDTNTKMKHCTTKSITVNTTSWENILALGPRINGMFDQVKEQYKAPLSGSRGVYSNGVPYDHRYSATVIYGNHAQGWQDSNRRNDYPGWYTTSSDRNNFLYSTENRYRPVHIEGRMYPLRGLEREVLHKDRITSNGQTSTHYYPKVEKVYDSRSMDPEDKRQERGQAAIVQLMWQPFTVAATGESLTTWVDSLPPLPGDANRSGCTGNGYIVKRSFSPPNLTESGALEDPAGSANWEVLNECNPINPNDADFDDTIDGIIRYEDRTLTLDDPRLPLNSVLNTSTPPTDAKFRKDANTATPVWYLVVYRLRDIELGFAAGLNRDAVVDVLIPPANMALIHRWMANKEQCELAGKKSLIKKNKHYRCSYGGLGHTKVGGVSSVIDQGGHLLVDRWHLGCNVSTSDRNVDIASQANLDTSGLACRNGSQLFTRNASGTVAQGRRGVCVTEKNNGQSMPSGKKGESVLYQINGDQGECMLNVNGSNTWRSINGGASNVEHGTLQSPLNTLQPATNLDNQWLYSLMKTTGKTALINFQPEEMGDALMTRGLYESPLDTLIPPKSDGEVFGGDRYVRNSTTNTALTATERPFAGFGGRISSNDSNLPPLTGVTPSQAYYLCQSHEVGINGKTMVMRKRLLSSKEHVLTTLPSETIKQDHLDGIEKPDPGYTFYQNRKGYEYGYGRTWEPCSGCTGARYDYYGYNDRSQTQHYGFCQVHNKAIPDQTNGKPAWGDSIGAFSYNLRSTGNETDFAGSVKCVNRFGVQDYVGFLNTWLGDQALCNIGPGVANDCHVHPDANEAIGDPVTVHKERFLGASWPLFDNTKFWQEELKTGESQKYYYWASAAVDPGPDTFGFGSFFDEYKMKFVVLTGDPDVPSYDMQMTTALLENDSLKNHIDDFNHWMYRPLQNNYLNPVVNLPLNCQATSSNPNIVAKTVCDDDDKINWKSLNRLYRSGDQPTLIFLNTENFANVSGAESSAEDESSYPAAAKAVQYPYTRRTTTDDEDELKQRTLGFLPEWPVTYDQYGNPVKNGGGQDYWKEAKPLSILEGAFWGKDTLLKVESSLDDELNRFQKSWDSSMFHYDERTAVRCAVKVTLDVAGSVTCVDGVHRDTKGECLENED